MADATQPLPPEVAGLFVEEPAPEGKGAEAAPAPAAQSTAQEWIAAVEMGAAMLTAIKPALKPVWSKDRCAQLGAAVAGVAAKYGWTAGGLFEKYQAEITLAMIAAPMLIETRAVLAAEAAPADDPQPEAATPAPREQPQAPKGPTLSPNTGA